MHATRPYEAGFIFWPLRRAKTGYSCACGFFFTGFMTLVVVFLAVLAVVSTKASGPVLSNPKATNSASNAWRFTAEFTSTLYVFLAIVKDGANDFGFHQVKIL